MENELKKNLIDAGFSKKDIDTCNFVLWVKEPLTFTLVDECEKVGIYHLNPLVQELPTGYLIGFAAEGEDSWWETRGATGRPPDLDAEDINLLVGWGDMEILWRGKV